MNIIRCAGGLGLLLIIAGCSNVMRQVPVETLKPITRSLNPTDHYVVQKGDTLAAISRSFSKNYEAIANINHLKSPYSLQVGQVLLVRDTPIKKSIASHKTHSKPKKKITGNALLKKHKLLPQVHPEWIKPTKGNVVKRFSKNGIKNNGIEISGRYGQNVLAVNSGIVVYSGIGLRGYGKLIIIKHPNHMLSAYAFNKELLVKEGQVIKVGQVIAKMGNNNRGSPRLHLEIRKNGHPVDPLKYVKWS